MEKEYCDDCFCRMRAWDYDENDKVVQWDHCDHKDRGIPISMVKECPGRIE